MKANHTQGEWNYQYSTSTAHRVFTDDIETPIAIVFGVDKVSESEANARLIAASPKMYAALERIVVELEKNNVSTAIGLANEALELGVTV